MTSSESSGLGPSRPAAQGGQRRPEAAAPTAGPAPAKSLAAVFYTVAQRRPMSPDATSTTRTGNTVTATCGAAKQSRKYATTENIPGQAMVLFCSLMRRRINAKHHRIVKHLTTGSPDRERSGLSYGIRPPAPGSCDKSTNRRWSAPPFFQLSLKSELL